MLFDLTPSTASVAMFAVGWTTGWLLLWRLRPLPEAPARSKRPAVAVVIPARNEAHSISGLVTSIAAQLQAGDELVVVDDHSSDATGAIARAAGATVVKAPDLTDGWAGKPHACFVGANSTIAPILVFVDSDVSPAPDLLHRLVSAMAPAMSDGSASGPDAAMSTTLISVQPWHAVGSRWYEPLSWMFNVVGLMGSAGFTVFGSHRATASKIAFGPVLACDRETYELTGGHGHPTVRAAVTEDIALARLFDRVELYSGRPDTSFRMYPDGVAALTQGWTKNMAAGAVSAQWWIVAMTVAWICSLAGGWLASPWFCAASAIQVFVQTRRAGRFTVLTSLLYPVGVAFFVAIFVRSAVLRTLRKPVTWKGRRVASR